MPQAPVKRIFPRRVTEQRIPLLPGPGPPGGLVVRLQTGLPIAHLNDTVFCRRENDGVPVNRGAALPNGFVETIVSQPRGLRGGAEMGIPDLVKDDRPARLSFAIVNLL
jgi:hypothetical protein